MKVLILYDVKGWAWYFKAQALQKYLKDDFEKIDIAPSKWIKNNQSAFKKYHHISWMGWLEGKRWARQYKGTSAGISSHNYYYKHFGMAKKRLPNYGALTCVSKILYDELKARKLNKNIYLCQNGVDENVFQPDPIKHDKFTVGWMGQPTHGDFKGQQLDMHGYEHVLLPLVESLKEHKNIEFRIMAKTFKNAVSHSEMPRWYNGLDLFLHTGFGTGTPNGVFEAMACGVPCSSIAIGAAPEVIDTGAQVNGFLVDRYYSKNEARQRIEEFKTDILWCENRRDGCKTLGARARKTIEESWTWKERARAWIKPFKNHAKKL